MQSTIASRLSGPHTVAKTAKTDKLALVYRKVECPDDSEFDSPPPHICELSVGQETVLSVNKHASLSSNEVLADLLVIEPLEEVLDRES